MKRLKVQVERAVRPVRASESRKDRIREELYGHLWSLFEEELEQTAGGIYNINTADEDSEIIQTAIDRALLNFGDPELITTELQETIPATEGILFTQLPTMTRMEKASERWLRVREKETLPHWATRMSISLICINSFIVFFLNPALRFALTGNPDIARLSFTGSIVLLLMGGLVFSMSLLNSGMTRRLLNRENTLATRALEALPFAVAMSGVIVFAGAFFAYSLQAFMIFDIGDTSRLGTVALLTPLVAASLSLAVDAENRRRVEWGASEAQESVSLSSAAAMH